MYRILVGYDGSDPSRHALDRAIDIASRFDAPLTVLTAADKLLKEKGSWTAAADEEAAQQCAEEGAARARAAGLTKVDTRTPVETPAEALLAVEKEGYNLIVVGHRGHNPLEELFLGSVAKRVVDGACCSVLIVR